MRFIRVAAIAACLLSPIAAALISLKAAAAAPPSLEVPIDCDMRQVCAIHKYFDLDPGPGRMDFACGRLTQDRHDGVDFRLPDFPAMQRGVAVLAAAPGVVKAIRDGMADVSVKEIGAEAIKGREAGNGVVIDHGDGWVTQYAHLRRGSVAVKPGERVSAGQRLGFIGLSGETEYPHVHFAVRHNGRSLDPFVGEATTFTCGNDRHPLWSPAALAQLNYRPSGGLIVGFAAQRPDANAARDGAYAQETLSVDAPALVVWADSFGILEGDTQRIRIIGPDRAEVHNSETVLSKSNMVWFGFSGLRRPQAGWKPGEYTGIYEIVRAGVPVVSMTKRVQIAGE
ncbi:MAG: M23 family metallopeptidase [Rhodospirillales bacterium]|nr:M23 family metallopeptidase [Rhodospirillales bacterium]